ncbi:glycosyltransferase family 4 protein [Aplosporella prunicola CBS 121167]|uniref:GDP-Man:Man(3)GlcNAc(2)-PP-Dol alpha-1,2-mannosyltransferase n=1 Tax=Aplosporella prunicola CBS 121167 TaxID=1176127 RepID=A0A6A6BG55_9PEZI|nr:glycosyltransferase family 4 protein [Aplosporella prunicola CBS 121167]KAF2142558.1 glycosyltransferase family 4 protein [Aplosporella prunicola CBS 121167]
MIPPAILLAALPLALWRSDSPLSAALAKLCTLLYVAIRVLPLVVRLAGIGLGRHIRARTQPRRELLLARLAADEKEYKAKQQKRGEDDDWEKVDQSSGSSSPADVVDKEWKGVVGFFHPFCNAGGGGERVLWAAIRTTQKRYPNALCVVYTGDHDVDKAAILQRVEDRFNIHLHPPTVAFLYVSTRHYVLASTWPHFTLLGQSIGSLILAHDALSLLVPDIFIDTMGYAFALGLCKFYFPLVPTGAYVHYPTISTDMLDSLSATDLEREGKIRGVNSGAGQGIKGTLKRWYWLLFAKLYSGVGAFVDVVMTNSSWTQKHMENLWGPRPERVSCFDSLVLSHALSRKGVPTEHAVYPIEVVFPPVAVEELEQQIEVSEATEAERGPYLLYIAQFRPEKNHQLILDAFAELLGTWPQESEKPKLVLIGSVRNPEDATRVYNLRLLAHELRVKESVEFICDATWAQILAWLGRASVGINGMWNEHFGIGVVEYQAAGLISVVNDSGGPKVDIVTEVDGEATGELGGAVVHECLLTRQVSMPRQRASSPRASGGRSGCRGQSGLRCVCGRAAAQDASRRRSLRRGGRDRWSGWWRCSGRWVVEIKEWNGVGIGRDVGGISPRARPRGRRPRLSLDRSVETQASPNNNEAGDASSRFSRRPTTARS